MRHEDASSTFPGPCLTGRRITAGVGGPAYAGIPTTHRDTNSAVTFITGHASSGEVPDGLDWPALARGSPVLVIYMALKHLAEISHRLIAAGRDPAEPRLCQEPVPTLTARRDRAQTGENDQ